MELSREDPGMWLHVHKRWAI